MIQASLHYPRSEGARFDFGYWTERHLPYIRRVLGRALQGLTAEKGLPNGPDAPALYIASGHLHFESVDALRHRYATLAAAIAADLKSFTNVQPVLLPSEVLID